MQEIAQLSNPVEQDLYLDRIAQQQNVSKDSLKVNLLKYRRQFNTAKQHTSGQIPNETEFQQDDGPAPEYHQDIAIKNDPEIGRASCRERV